MRLKCCMCVGHLGDRVLFTAKTSSVEKLPIDDHSEEILYMSGFFFRNVFHKNCVWLWEGVLKDIAGARGEGPTQEKMG